MDGALQQRRHHAQISGTSAIGAAATGATLKACRNASYTIFVQTIVVTATTGSAGKTWSIADSGTGPSLTGLLPMDTAPETYAFDFGALGRPLAVGKDLVLVCSAAGAGGTISWEGYVKPTVTVDGTAGAASQ